MKRTVRVTIEKEFDIEFKEELLTKEFVEQFEDYLFELDGDTHEEKIESLFKFAGTQLSSVNFGEDQIEALGYCVGESSVGASYLSKNAEDYTVIYKENYEDIEAEVV